MTKFEKETSEKLASIETRLEEQSRTLFKQLNTLTDMIQGNGHPGLCTRVAILEDQQSPSNKALGERLSVVEKQHVDDKEKAGNRAEWIAIIVTFVSSVCSFFFGK